MVDSEFLNQILQKLSYGDYLDVRMDDRLTLQPNYFGM